MLRLERVAEKMKEGARADVQKQRRNSVWLAYTLRHIHQPSVELSEKGWHEEIAACKSMYGPGLMEIKGVAMARPLGEKGTHVPDP